VLFGTTAGDTVSGSNSSSATSPKFAVNFQLSPDVLLFAKIAEGFRGGGANIVDLAQYPEATSGYGPDSLVAYEIGLKTSPADGWFVNAYAFYNDWTDLQLPFRTNDGLIGFTTNAGSATAKGAELEIGGGIGDALEVGLTYSYTDSTIDDDVRNPTGILIAQAGSRIPQSPKSKVAVTASYVARLTDSLEGQANIRYRQASGFHSDPPNSPDFYNDGSKQLFASFGITGNWGTIRLYGDNLLDRDDTTIKYRPIAVLPYI
jgi:outer membrane receptor protein involved in Fe transport